MQLLKKLLILAMLFCSTSTFSQIDITPVIPVDPNVKIGKLPTFKPGNTEDALKGF